MKDAQVQMFIEKLIYDIETIEYLLEYERLKETIPIFYQILMDIDLFRKEALGDQNWEDVFSYTNWLSKHKNQDSFQKIFETLQACQGHYGGLSNKDLESRGYRSFLKEFFLWAKGDIRRLQTHSGILIKNTKRYVFVLIFVFIGAGLLFLSPKIFNKNASGLRFDYYEGMDFQRKLGTAVSPKIFFGHCSEISRKLPLKEFSIRWEGLLNVPETGEHFFRLTTNDGFRLYVDENLVIDRWDKERFTSQEGLSIHLLKGLHRIKLEYRNHVGGCLLRLEWGRLSTTEISPITEEYLQW